MLCEAIISSVTQNQFIWRTIFSIIYIPYITPIFHRRNSISFITLGGKSSAKIMSNHNDRIGSKT